MTPSLSARLPRPTGRPRVPNAGPAPVLALWPAAALAPGRVAAHVWHGQTRLGERFHLRCERSAPVIAVASARQECAQLLCLLHFSNRCMHNLRIGTGETSMAGGRETRGGAASAARAAGTEVVVRSCGAPRASRRIADVRGSCRRTDPRNSDDGGVEANDTTPASPSSTNLTTAVSGRRLAGALVLGPGVSSWQTRRLNSLNRKDETGTAHLKAQYVLRVASLLPSRAAGRTRSAVVRCTSNNIVC